MEKKKKEKEARYFQTHKNDTAATVSRQAHRDARSHSLPRRTHTAPPSSTTTARTCTTFHR